MEMRKEERDRVPQASDPTKVRVRKDSGRAEKEGKNRKTGGEAHEQKEKEHDNPSP